MPNEIPTKARQIVKERDGGQCCRCGMPGNEIHHRQRRRDAGHPVCVLMTVCHECHRWIHANPVVSKVLGWIISPWQKNPADQKMKTFMGWVKLDNEGGVEFAEPTKTEGDAHSV